MHKDEVISPDASWIFRSAPYIIFTTTIIVGLSIPLFASFLKNALTGDLLVVAYTFALGTFFLALAGMDTGSAFGGFGSSREATISALAEGGLILSFFAVSVIIGTTNLFTISRAGILLSTSFFLPAMLAFIGFFIILLAETGRFPFDNPATHLELTMIHEAMILEYSGPYLAMLEFASSIKITIFALLVSNFIWPSSLMATDLSLTAILLAIFWSVIKLVVVMALLAILESVIAKMRFYRMQEYLTGAFFLAAAGMIMTLIAKFI